MPSWSRDASGCPIINYSRLSFRKWENMLSYIGSSIITPIANIAGINWWSVFARKYSTKPLLWVTAREASTKSSAVCDGMWKATLLQSNQTARCCLLLRILDPADKSERTGLPDTFSSFHCRRQTFPVVRFSSVLSGIRNAFAHHIPSQLHSAKSRKLCH